MDTSNAKLASGFLSDHEALGVGGDPIYRAAEQIRTLLQKELGEPVAKIFAIPVRNDKTNELDWYSPIEGSALRLQQLSPEEQAKIKEIIATRFASIDQFGSRLKNEIGTEAARTYASLLDSAKSYPNDDQIFVISGQPVITFWGFKNNPLSRASGLTANLPASVSPLSLEQSVNQSPKRSWWQRFGWWLVLAALLLFGVPAVLKSCGTDFPLYKQNADPQNCSQPDTSSNCKEEIASPKAKEQVLTPEALKRNDLSVFEGKWVLSSDLVNITTGQKISVILDLDKSGQGTGYVFDNTEGKCSGASRVSIGGSETFQVNQDSMRCSSGRGWVGNVYSCTVRPNHVQADCSLTCVKKSGERYTCNSVFEKR
jgi:hypothetical protein